MAPAVTVHLLLCTMVSCYSELYLYAIIRLHCM